MAPYWDQSRSVFGFSEMRGMIGFWSSIWAKNLFTNLSLFLVIVLVSLVIKSDEIKDPWGTPYVILCGDQAPEACEGFCALSLGPDKKQDTGDDIKSWEKPKKK